MSYIGKVFNRATAKSINVLISDSGDNFKRLTGAISQDVKDAALALVKERFEEGSVFKDHHMKSMDHIVITNMPHESSGDPNAHYSVQGETAAGIKVKGGHVPLDKSKQTQAN